MNIDVKIRLHAQCLNQVEQRMGMAKEAMDVTQAAAGMETKSSAGDKYETGREMVRQEQEKNARQLLEALKLKKVLDQLNPTKKYEQVQPGSLVITNHGMFYISISLGKVTFSGRDYMAISAVSPLGQKLIGLRPNDRLSFNGRDFLIQQVV